MLLKLWLLGAVVGVYSGREIARRLHYDLRFRCLAAGLRPNFRTINRFRERHLKDFRAVFLQTLRVAQAMGLLKLGQVIGANPEEKAEARMWLRRVELNITEHLYTTAFASAKDWRRSRTGSTSFPRQRMT